MRRLAQRAGVPIVEEAGSAGGRRRHALRKRLACIARRSCCLVSQQLFKVPAAQEARNYLKSRDISVEIAKSWLLGYAPDSRDALERIFSADSSFR